MSYILEQQHDRLSNAVIIAILAHALLLLALFVTTDTSNNNKQLDVSVSNKKTDDRPENPNYLSWNNQLGGSLDATHKEASSKALPTIHSNEQHDNLQIEKRQNFLVATEKDRRIIYTQSTIPEISVVRISSNDLKHEVNNDDFERTENLSDRIASLETKINKQHQLASSKRKAIITSASTLQANDAAYLYHWKMAVETAGNNNYPKEAINKQLYGDVRLMVRLMANGNVDTIKLLASSGHTLLDKAAIDSVRLGQPFNPFPTSMKVKYDQLEIIRTWQFRKDRLSTIIR